MHTNTCYLFFSNICLQLKKKHLLKRKTAVMRLLSVYILYLNNLTDQINLIKNKS